MIKAIREGFGDLAQRHAVDAHHRRVSRRFAPREHFHRDAGQGKRRAAGAHEPRHQPERSGLRGVLPRRLHARRRRRVRFAPHVAHPREGRPELRRRSHRCRVASSTARAAGWRRPSPRRRTSRRWRRRCARNSHKALKDGFTDAEIAKAKSGWQQSFSRRTACRTSRWPDRLLSHLDSGRTFLTWDKAFEAARARADARGGARGAAQVPGSGQTDHRQGRRLRQGREIQLERGLTWSRHHAHQSLPA